MPHWFGRLMVALRHLEFGFHLTSANLNLEPPYLNRDPMSLTGALLVSHVSFIPMALPFPCLSYSHVSLIPVSHPFLCLPILISLPFPYLSHSHVSLILIPVSLPYPCLSHSHVSPIPISIPYPSLSHSHASLILMSLLFQYHAHSHISPVLFCSVVFVSSIIITICWDIPTIPYLSYYSSSKEGFVDKRC